MLPDAPLSEHFSFYELTVTGNAALQEANRVDALRYKPTLIALARFLEIIRGKAPLIVNSAFRSAALNKATAGSSPTSQHPLGQAADIRRPNQSPTVLFADLRRRFRDEKIPFGQLILESAKRDYGMVEWVHVSLGADFWKPERCGEVLRKWDDEAGKPHFEMIERIPQELPT